MILSLNQEAQELQKKGVDVTNGAIGMAGALDRASVTADVLSHQATYGVGYGIAEFTITGEDPSRAFGDIYLAKQAMDIKLKEAQSDDYVILARKAVEEFVLHHSTLPLTPLLPEEMLSKRAGVFVSIHVRRPDRRLHTRAITGEGEDGPRLRPGLA